ncbi:MAG: histone deacetylase [Myxococcales bacterium]|nr:histone deacetylase [Myxococcales bacterium]
MRTGLVTNRLFREHVAPAGHPERPARLDAIDAALDAAGLPRRCVQVPARAATRAELERVHAPEYLDALERVVGGATEPGWLDPDTYFSVGSWQAALLAAGSTVDIALAVADGTLDNGIAFVRPPGHHATRDAAMGFCLINSIAVAAAALRARGLRVAIVDFDVHHGNGTEAIFWDDPEVLYASTHQYPFYPGTGALTDVGGPSALGATMNLPLPAGSGDAAYLAALALIRRAALRFRPDAILLSAGFDAHRLDPLASMQVGEATFARFTEELRACTGGRIAAVLEGGYDLDGLGCSAVATVAALLGDPLPAVNAGPLTAPEREALAAAARIHFGDPA